MKPFIQVAIPHEDVLKGRLTMDVFAADLWQVVTGKAPPDYQDPDLFFRKTYPTKGLKNILEIAEARLKGKSGDSVVQLQTPFGGGKTHTLIALYHKAREWGAKVVVFDGTALNPRNVRLWEELERQLTGKISLTKGDISPGKEVLIKLLFNNAPVLILMDEVLEYTTRAAGIKVGDTNLASQTLAFIHELTGAVSAIGNALLVLTLPSSILEHYDENAERLFQQLQKITGRTERIYTPVEDDEIEHVVRARLFSRVDEREAKRVVDEFVDYAKSEGLLSGDEAASYREKFLRSYPFKPEVIDILYKRWGSFPTFQRTRGVLRLLSLVVHDILDKNVPYIRLGDFNLKNDEIKRELIKHIGQEWESIIAQDITSENSGAKRVDESLGTSYRPYNLGTVVSTTIFMLSFSGRGEKGVSVREVKLSVAHPEFSSTVIDTVISNLRERLFYLSDEGLYFMNKPNLNRIILLKEEDISESNIYEEELKLINKHISKSKFKVYIHPKFPKDIPDTSNIKLVILNTSKPDQEFLEKCGESPRVYRNTLFFLCVDENQRETFHLFLRRLIALRRIESDKSLKLTEGQKKEVKNKIKSYEQREYEELRKYYRKLFLPSRDGFKEMDMGIPTFGESKLDKEVFDYLKSQGEILERLTPKVIKDKYLHKEYVEAKKLYEAFLKTPGEIRLISKDAYINSLKEGVLVGLFGYGIVEEGQVKCQYLKETPTINLAENEIIVSPDICESKKETTQIKMETQIKTEKAKIQGTQGITQTVIEEEATPDKEKDRDKLTRILLKLKVPVGQISTVAKIANYLSSKFGRCVVEIRILAEDGKILRTDYEDKILEAIDQGNIEIVEEDIG